MLVYPVFVYQLLIHYCWPRLCYW